MPDSQGGELRDIVTARIVKINQCSKCMCSLPGADENTLCRTCDLERQLTALREDNASLRTRFNSQVTEIEQLRNSLNDARRAWGDAVGEKENTDG
jgi:predicted RNase H-like nuclease (RuvC/YqgF family)